MPLFNQRKLAQLSREPRFLVQACIMLVVLALMISGTISALLPAKKSNDHSKSKIDSKIAQDLDADSLANIIRNRNSAFLEIAPRDFNDLLIFQSEDEDQSPDYAVLERRTESSTSINEGYRERLLLLLDALHCSDERRTEAVEKLLLISGDKRYRNEFLGDAYLAIEEPEKAIAAYTREGELFEEASYSQRSAVIAYTKRKETEALRSVLSKPGFQKNLTSHESIECFALTVNYKQLFFDAFKFKFELMRPASLIIALFTGFIWFVILSSMGNFSVRQTVIGLVAFFLGMISAVVTIFTGEVQRHFNILAFREDDSVLDQLLSMIAGIGLREETLKLICFAPVAFAIARYRNPILALITAAFTGLGFATMENLTYYVQSPDKFSIWGRMLATNPVHFCLTGIVGFSLYKLIRNRGWGWENFLADFLLVVALHGVYDGFQMMPLLRDYSIVSFVILVLIAYRFLDLVREHMPTEGLHRKVSPLGVFVIGSALLACGIMIMTAVNQNLAQAVGAFAGAVGGSIPIAFAFISRFRDL